VPDEGDEEPQSLNTKPKNKKTQGPKKRDDIGDRHEVDNGDDDYEGGSKKEGSQKAKKPKEEPAFNPDAPP